MPVGLSDGTYHEDYTLMVADSASRMPLGSPTEPAGALKSGEGGQVPGKEPETKNGVSDTSNFFQRLSLINPIKAMFKGPNIEEDKALLSGFYGSIKNAFKLPGDVYGGKIDPMSTQGIERAFDLAGLAVLGPAPVAAKMADGTLGSFAGVRSKTVDKPSLRLAHDAEIQGFSQDEIYKSTGWFRGADNRWRYEIDDSAAAYHPQNLKESSRPLSDVLGHKELYEAYPELREVKVKVSPSLKNGAQYDKSINLIELGPEAAKDKGILMHEVQHAIQNIEDFSKGGSPGKSGRDYKLKYEEDIQRLRPRFLDLQTKEMRGEFLTAPQQAELDRLRAVFKKYVEYSRAGDQLARENYLALAGEAEARNVQTRVDLSPEERLKFNPIDTEDVRRELQITRQHPSSTTPYAIPHPYSGEIDFHTY